MNTNKMMIKKLVIKLFKLNDLSDILFKAKQQQKTLDEKYWKEKMSDREEHLNRERELELQELYAQISMLEDKLKVYKAREKELDSKEYMIKREAKEQAFMATKIALKVDDFGLKILGIVGEMKGIKDDAELNRKRVEQK